MQEFILKRANGVQFTSLRNELAARKFKVNHHDAGVGSGTFNALHANRPVAVMTVKGFTPKIPAVTDHPKVADFPEIAGRHFEEVKSR